jgi:hypothetical protein
MRLSRFVFVGLPLSIPSRVLDGTIYTHNHIDIGFPFQFQTEPQNGEKQWTNYAGIENKVHLLPVWFSQYNPPTSFLQYPKPDLNRYILLVYSGK